MKQDTDQDTRHSEGDIHRRLTDKEDEFFRAVETGASREVRDRLFAEVENLRVLADASREPRE